MSLPAVAQLEFSFTYSSSVPASEKSGIEAAVARAAEAWQTHLQDAITVNVVIDWAPIASGSKAISFVDYERRTYSEVYTALGTDRSSPTDFSSFAKLQDDAQVEFLINYTVENPAGPGSSTPYLDDDSDLNNRILRLSFANSKAIGLRAAQGTDRDGRIVFDANKTWDYFPADGIAPGDFDFGVTTLHELGHILGFTSRIDSQLGNDPGKTESEYDFIVPLDLYVYSIQSAAQGEGVFDWTLDTRSKYFSTDGGASVLAYMSTGVSFGDGQSRGHWRNATTGQDPIGVMDPSTVSFQTIQDNDLIVMDLIGFDLLPGIIPIVDCHAKAGGEVFLEWVALPNATDYQVYRQINGSWTPELGGSYVGETWTRNFGSTLPDLRHFRVTADAIVELPKSNVQSYRAKAAPFELKSMNPARASALSHPHASCGCCLQQGIDH